MKFGEKMSDLSKVSAAAIIGYDGKVYSLPRPARHHDIIHYMAKDLKHPIPISGDQGFVLDDGNFVDRGTAKKHALANNQLLERASKLNILFSEDVW